MFRLLAHHPRLVAPLEQIFGESLYVHQFKLNAKAAFEGDVWQWHQDYGTWARDDGMPEPRAMNISVFLDEVMAINGPLMFIPKSHKHGVLAAGHDLETTSYPLWTLDEETVTRLVKEGGDQGERQRRGHPAQEGVGRGERHGGDAGHGAEGEHGRRAARARGAQQPWPAPRHPTHPAPTRDPFPSGTTTWHGLTTHREGSLLIAHVDDERFRRAVAAAPRSGGRDRAAPGRHLGPVEGMVPRVVTDPGVRPFEMRGRPMAGWLRATARLDAEEDRLLNALKEVLS